MEPEKEPPKADWRNKEWSYIPAADHADSTKFRERMEQRRIAVQQQKSKQ